VPEIPKRPESVVIPPVRTPEQAQALIDHEHAVAVRAVEALQQMRGADFNLLDAPRIAGAVLRDIHASGWRKA